MVLTLQATAVLPMPHSALPSPTTTESGDAGSGLAVFLSLLEASWHVWDSDVEEAMVARYVAYVRADAAQQQQRAALLAAEGPIATGSGGTSCLHKCLVALLVAASVAHGTVTLMASAVWPHVPGASE